MKVAVLGAGAWGTALAMHISQQHSVCLWAHKQSHVDGMRRVRANPMYLGDFPFNDHLKASMSSVCPLFVPFMSSRPYFTIFGRHQLKVHISRLL